MYKGYKYIDSDGHVLEPQDMWERYLDPEFRDEMPSHYARYEGDDVTFHLEVHVGGYTLPNFPTGRGVAIEGLPEAYGAYASDGFTPANYKTMLDKSGIDYMVVYPTVGLFNNGIPNLKPATAAAYRRAYNDWLHDFCSEGDGRVLGAGAIDLRDPKEAAKEARRCIKDLGMKAITLNPEPVNDLPMHDEFFDPIWAEIQDLDVGLGVHVGAGTANGQVGSNYFPEWGIGRSASAFTMGNMLASVSFVAGGILERFPKLRIVHLESGAGWVPFWMDRLEAGIAGSSRRTGYLRLPLTPKEYFQRQCFVSADPDDPGVKLVVDYMGDQSIVTATDFGHPEGRGYVRAIEDTIALPDVSDEIKRRVMWDNAARLYNIA